MLHLRARTVRVRPVEHGALNRLRVSRVIRHFLSQAPSLAVPLLPGRV